MWWVILIEGLVISVLGSILHFTYGWSKGNKFVGIFSAVNESTWEHIKLALSSIFGCTLVDMWFLGDNPNYWFAKSMEFVTPVIVIPVIFYSYTAFSKKPILPVDILSFVVAAFMSAGVFAGMLELYPMGETGEIVSMVITVAIMVAYLLLTRFPMHDFLFRDPTNGKYGLVAAGAKRKRVVRRRSRGRKKSPR